MIEKYPNLNEEIVHGTKINISLDTYFGKPGKIIHGTVKVNTQGYTLPTFSIRIMGLV